MLKMNAPPPSIRVNRTFPENLQERIPSGTGVSATHLAAARVFLVKVALFHFNWCQNFVLQFFSSMQPKSSLDQQTWIFIE